MQLIEGLDNPFCSLRICLSLANSSQISTSRFFMRCKNMPINVLRQIIISEDNPASQRDVSDGDGTSIITGKPFCVFPSSLELPKPLIAKRLPPSHLQPKC